jgi:septum site-determining protein MinC
MLGIRTIIANHHHEMTACQAIPTGGRAEKYMSNPATAQQGAKRFRSRSYLAFVLAPEPPIFGWLANLDKWISQSTEYFTGKPVVLDLSDVKLSDGAIIHLIGELLARNIRVMGLEGIEQYQIGPNLPPVLRGGRSATAAEPTPGLAPPEDPDPPQKAAASLLLENPVRSGQSIVFPEGDITVLGSVASGAEVIAGGSIHIYGALRGRAFAGLAGNSRARIFCNKVEAELLAIDGLYRTADEIEPNLRSQPIQAWLKGDMLLITPLN